MASRRSLSRRFMRRSLQDSLCCAAVSHHPSPCTSTPLLPCPPPLVQSHAFTYDVDAGDPGSALCPKHIRRLSANCKLISAQKCGFFCLSRYCVENHANIHQTHANIRYPNHLQTSCELSPESPKRKPSHALLAGHLGPVQTALLPIAYSPSFFNQLLLHPFRLCLLAHDQDATPSSPPIAFVSAAIDPTFPGPVPRLQILTLGVTPEYRRSGIGLHLVREVVSQLRASIAPVLTQHEPEQGTLVTAYVSASNAPAQRLCSVLGMRAEGHVMRDMYRTLSGSARDAYFLVGTVH